MSQPPNPHDKLFKAAFSDREVVKEFIQHGLPDKLSKNLQLDSLRLTPVSYLSPMLSEFYSDIVYSCIYKETTLSIALLFEHKSYIPTYPHLQLLRYMVEAWDKMLAQEEPLRLIIPIIVYHGDRKWKYKDIRSYFGIIPEDLLPFLPSFTYVLSDLSKWPDEYFDRAKESLLNPVVRLLKYNKNRPYLRTHFLEIFTLLEPFVQKDAKHNLAISLFVYLTKVSKISQEDMIKLTQQLPPHINKLAMTTYEQFVKKGEAEGKNQVIKKGFLKGLSIELLAELTSLKISEVEKRLKAMELI